MLAALLMIPYFSSCKDEKTGTKSDKKELTNFKIVVGTEEITEELIPQLQSDGATWLSLVDLNFDHELLKTATIHFTLSDGASSYPASGATVDISAPLTIGVKAEDNSTFYYTLETLDGTSSDADLISFTLQIGAQTIGGKIDYQNSKVIVCVPKPIVFRLEEAVPVFTLSLGATANHNSGVMQNFLTPITYTITAHDGTPRVWTVEIVEEELGGMFHYFGNNTDDSRTIYCDAVRRAGLEDVIATGNVTCVVPNNSAWTPFLNSVGASSVEEVNPVVLKAIIQYLIFPGDYRAQTMTSGEKYRIPTLSGDPIWISRSPTETDKYRVLINDNNTELASSPVTVQQQDYIFDNNVIAQVVDELVTYRLKVPVTEDIPDNVDNSQAKKDTLFITDDCHVYIAAAGRDNNYNNNQAMALISPRIANSERVGLFKTKLKNIDFAEDIVKAEFTARVAFVVTYYGGLTCQIDFHKLRDVAWTESTATYSTMEGGLVYPLATSEFLASSTFFVPGTAGLVPADAVFRDNPVYVKWDITGHILNAYQVATNPDTHQLAFALYDNSERQKDTGTAIRLCMKDYSTSTVPPFLSYVAMMGPIPSKMTLRNNNVITPQDGTATLTPATSFAMEGPAVSDGYDYSDKNIIYTLKVLPMKGVLTKYSIPMKSMDNFTQAEMEAGMIKYLKTGAGADSFGVSATDYTTGMYFAGGTNILTVNVN